jgi:hypothetical protein
MGTIIIGVGSIALAYFVLGAVGYLLAKKFKQPVTTATWVLIIIATILAPFVGISIRLISIFGFTIYLNRCLHAFGIGLIIGLVIELMRFRAGHKTLA